MSTQGDDRPVTAAELAGVRGEITEAFDELRQGLADLKDAATPAQRQEAQGDVADAQRDLAAAAQRLGISPEKLQEAATEARKAERKEELRPIISELMTEAKEAADQEAADQEAQRLADEEANKTKGDGKTKDDGKTKKDGASVTELVPDTEPVTEHWSERGVGALLK